VYFAVLTVLFWNC